VRQLAHYSFRVCDGVLCRILIVLGLLWRFFCLFCVVGASIAGLRDLYGQLLCGGILLSKVTSVCML
jgi:hypothetical protein